MPIINQHILNLICEYHLASSIIPQTKLMNLIDFSNELNLFLEILL